MVSRRAINGVLRNFLGTYTSRYSAYHGYWLFGFLIPKLVEVDLNLLARGTDAPNTPMEVAATLASTKFASQIEKSGLRISQLRSAWLKISTLPDAVAGSVNSVSCTGYKVRFSVVAVMDNDKEYRQELEIFVAPHNELAEFRSARDG